MVSVFDDYSFNDSMALSFELRKAGVAVSCYPESAKLEKQLKFADRMGIRFVLILGPDEITNGEVNLKDLASTSQVKLKRNTVAQELKRLLVDE